MYPHEYATLSRLEDDYWWYVGLKRLVLALVRKYANLNPVSTVLDIGCGTGGTLSFFEKQEPGPQFYGMDLNPLAIDLAKKRCRGKLVRGSANELPFPGALFDLAISLDVFYIQGIDDQKALLETYRVLKPGGSFVLNLPAWECLRGEHDLAVHTRHRYRAPELREKLKRAGFQIRRLTYWNAFLFPLVYAARRILRAAKPRSKTPTSDLKPLPAFLNETLKGMLWLEKSMAVRVDLPFGSSVLAVAEKPKK